MDPLVRSEGGKILVPPRATASGLLLVGLYTCVITLLLVWPWADISLGGDHYVHLANRLAHGSLNVDDLSPRYGDYVQWGGHKYLPFGPLPAVLLIPFLWLWNAGVPLAYAGYALTLANALLFRGVLARMGVTGARKEWLVLLYFGGSVYLSIALGGISTFFAHIVATTFLILATLESFGRFRMVLVGVLLGLAAAARLTVVFMLPFFLWRLWHGLPRSGGKYETHRRVSDTALLIAGLAVPLAFIAFYNYARFGDPLETGFGMALLYDPILETARSKGLFSLAHVPTNVRMMLIQGPELVLDGQGRMDFPWLRPSPWGMGLFFTSPALIYAFRAPLRDPVVQACWGAIGFTLAPLLTYYGVGFVQFGYRYALDFMPCLMLIVAKGFPNPLTRLPRVLVAASVVINIWGAIFLSVWI